MKADPLRQQALEILIEVYDGAPLDNLLDQALANQSDRHQSAFLAELVRGTLQWQGRYQHILRQFVRRKLTSRSNELALFHMTLHQMLGLNGVPVYAAIHQAGELCRTHVSRGKVGFVNGVLQSIKRQLLPGDSPLEGQRESLMRTLFEDLSPDPAAYLAAWQSHPRWLVQRWIERFGQEKTEEILIFNNLPVGVAFHVLSPADPVAVAENLQSAGVSVKPGVDLRTLCLQERCSRAKLIEVLAENPSLIVQDPTVQEATGWLLESEKLLAKSALENFPVLDMCAAPGGKAGRLAAVWPGRGPVIAMDNRPGRVALLGKTVERLANPRIEVLQADGLTAPFPAGHFGAVLLDGPCSGTGVLRHHPDGRWQLNNRLPGRNGRILRKLAHAAVDLLAPGGVLMYATCSLEPQENELVLDKLLAERDDVVVAPAEDGNWQRQWLPGQSGIENGGDGFFAALLQKKGLSG
jgi:16S rRNA (cytosine967-C5)-methyltransferase